MKRVLINLCMALSLLLFWSAAADAKWWIFGKSDAAVSIEYLYINQIAFEESDTQVLLFKEFLTSGMIEIRGKARASKGSIGAVKISLDDRKTWQEAKLSSGGSFEYQFKPEEGKAYDLYIEVIDTLGKTNNVEETHKVIKLTDQNIRALIKEILDQMAAAYMAEAPAAFMRHVSEKFAGDELNLDYAVRRDFTFFDNIQLILTISNLAIGSKGNIYVNVSYSRFLIATRSGLPLRDRGITEFIFVQKGGQPKLYAMKYPLIFGVSDPQNVATGTIVSPQNTPTLHVDDNGNAEVVPFEEARRRIESGADPAGGSGIAAPANLRVTGGLVGHFVDLEYDSPTVPAAGTYETVTEQSPAASGPWQEIDRRDWDTFIRLDTLDRTVLYFRVRIARVGSGVLSLPSNVIAVDNR
ncbi:MAG: hypothetical protein C4519_26605 [Desulfobacteraceae bacterium]|nr:MAG: hypothetical protein C4519_26605 [Desulfobacteraceae bacterium]